MTKELEEALERGRRYLDKRMSGIQSDLKRELIAEAMRELGKRTSERKAKACRLNARLSWTPQAREKRKANRKRARVS